MSQLKSVNCSMPALPEAPVNAPMKILSYYGNKQPDILVVQLPPELAFLPPIINSITTPRSPKYINSG